MLPRLVFLGGGTSVPSGLPSMADFLDAAQRVEAEGSFGSDRFKGNFAEALRKWMVLQPKMNVEEAFVLYDLTSRLEDATVGIPPPSPQWLHDLHGHKASQSTFEREKLRYLIVKTIIDESTGAQTALQEQLVRELLGLVDTQEGYPIFVTSNWDTLIETAVQRVAPDHELDFGCFTEPPASGRTEPRGRVTILKIHGSVDWWICRSCRETHRASLAASIGRWEMTQPRDCPGCHGSDIMPAIVPPVSQKFGYDPTLLEALSAIWWETRNHLNTCAEAHFLGYSFPPTDVEFRVFVQQAFAFNLNLRRIGVITRKKKSIDEDRAFRERMVSILERRLNATAAAFAPDSPPVVTPSISERGFDGTLSGHYA